MPKVHQYWVYILASRSRTIYIGVTNSLVRRVLQHREGKANSFTTRYRITRLVYFEEFQFLQDAIGREKELKDWRRERKLTPDTAHKPILVRPRRKLVAQSRNAKTRLEA